MLFPVCVGEYLDRYFAWRTAFALDFGYFDRTDIYVIIQAFNVCHVSHDVGEIALYIEIKRSFRITVAAGAFFSHQIEFLRNAVPVCDIFERCYEFKSAALIDENLVENDKIRFDLFKVF